MVTLRLSLNRQRGDFQERGQQSKVPNMVCAVSRAERGWSGEGEVPGRPGHPECEEGYLVKCFMVCRWSLALPCGVYSSETRFLQ